MRIGGITEEGSVVIPYKADATGSGTNDIITAAEIPYKFFADRTGFIHKPRIICRLAAAGLGRVVMYRTSGFFQHLNHIECRLRKKLVNKTGNEKLNIHDLTPNPSP